MSSNKHSQGRPGRVGCPHYMAPEVVTRRLYGKGCDVWGAGVMLHVLLSGRLPFLGSGVRLQQSIARGRISFEAPEWKSISSSARDLVSKMLAANPHHRLSITEVLEHPWIRDRDKLQRQHLADTVEELKRYNARRKLKDDIYALQDAHVDPDVLRDMLRDNRLHQFLQLFDRISSTVMSPSRAPPGDAVSRCRDVIEVLSSPPCTNYLIDELMQLLASPHIQEFMLFLWKIFLKAKGQTLSGYIEEEWSKIADWRRGK
ncbi:hypothetical protein GQX74_011214 [Glossina fuscipes]|nr:hypothetical protein GQX74_011214 [Glossina fuscipes]